MAVLLPRQAGSNAKVHSHDASTQHVLAVLIVTSCIATKPKSSGSCLRLEQIDEV